MKKLIKKYFSTFIYFYRNLGYRIFTVIGFSILVGTLDAFGLTMFLPLLQMADGSKELSGEGLGNLSFIMDGFNAVGLPMTLKSALLVLFIFFSLKGLANFINLSYRVVVNQFFISSLRIKLTNLLSLYSFKRFVGSDVGRIQNTFTDEIWRINGAYNAYIGGLQRIFMTLVYLFFVFMVDYKFALLVCSGGLIINFSYNSIFKKTKEKSKDFTSQNSDFHGLVIQYISNFKYLKATGSLKGYGTKLNSTIKDIEVTNRKIGILNAIVMATREPLLIAVVCIVILIQVFALGGNLAAILVSLLFFYRALDSLMNFQNNYNTYLGFSGSIDNLKDFEDELKSHSENDGKERFSKFQKEISVKDISFGFGHKQILKNVSINIESNTSVALVGESGSGKTTLVNLISGLLNVDSGSVEIDGKNINRLKREDYQSRIGYIAQEAVIFNDTIYNNVTFWAEKTDENIKRFQKAIDQALISTFIDSLENKEETLLGNNGINLSGGQKQRVSIARELYKDIDILILDEATSALDSETEREIQNNIDALKGDYTMIIIAHRLSTIRNVDQIYLMDDGHIIGNGDFNGLINKSEKFKKMVELQEV